MKLGMQQNAPQLNAADLVDGHCRYFLPDVQVYKVSGRFIVEEG